MADDLTGLLERIRTEGLDRAEAESARILDEARQKAEAVLRDAREEAGALRQKAEQEAAAFEARGAKALEQAARDAILTVGEGVSALLTATAREQTDRALTPEVLAGMLTKLVEGYAAKSDDAPSLSVLLNEEQRGAVEGLLTGALAERLRAGVTLRFERGVVSGFRVSARDGAVEHDFTGPAIAEAIAQLVRPRLAEIVRAAVKGMDVPRGGASAKG